MVAFRNISTKPLAINTLARIFATLGCLLFLISLISPFYSLRFTTLDGIASYYYKSYESDYHSGMSRIVGHDWFFNYWRLPGIPWILVPMFVIQALTLLFGVAFIIFNRRILSLAPVLLSPLTIYLMTVSAGMMLSGYGGEYQLGFYLVFPSLALFLSAFVLNEIALKRQTKSTVLEGKSVAAEVTERVNG